MKKHSVFFFLLTMLAGLLLLATIALAQNHRPPITPENAGRVVELDILGQGLITGLDWSGDGRIVALTTMAGVWLYDADDLDAPPRLLENGNNILDAALNPDGSLLAIVDGETLQLWRLTEGNVIITTLYRSDESNAHGQATLVTFSPDGQMLAAVEAYGFGTNNILLWEVETGEQIAILEGHSSMINALAFSPDGSILASGAGFAYQSGSGGYVRFDPTARLWEVATGRELAVLPHDTPVHDLAFTAGGDVLVTSDGWPRLRRWRIDEATGGGGATELGEAQEARRQVFVTSAATTLLMAELLWEATAPDTYSLQVRDAEAGIETFQLGGHTNAILAVELNPEGSVLATASRDGTARFWDAATGEFQAMIGMQPGIDEVWHVAFNPDGTRLASAGGWRNSHVNVWDTATGERLLALPNGPIQAERVAFRPDGALISAGAGTLSLWNTHTGDQITTIYPPGLASRMALTADGRLMASVSGGTIILSEVDTGAIVAQMVGHEYSPGSANFVNNLVFDAEGALLASSAGDSTIRIWSAAGEKIGAQLAVIEVWVNSIALNPAGDLLAFSEPDGSILVWSLRQDDDGSITAGERRIVLEGHESWINSMVFSPDGTILASGGEDGTVRLWQIPTGLDGDAAQREALVVLDNHADSVTSVACNADGSLLASGSQDGTIRLWGLPTGE